MTSAINFIVVEQIIGGALLFSQDTPNQLVQRLFQGFERIARGCAFQNHVGVCGMSIGSRLKDMALYSMTLEKLVEGMGWIKRLWRQPACFQRILFAILSISEAQRRDNGINQRLIIVPFIDPALSHI